MKKHQFISILLCSLILTSCDKCKEIKGEINEKKVEKQFNYTIILDLSDRIIAEDQINRDTLLIAKIIESFENDLENGKLQIAIATQKEAIITEPDRKIFEASMFIDESKSIEECANKKSKLFETLKEVYLKAKFSDKKEDYKGADIFQAFDDLRLKEEANEKISTTNFIFVITDGYQYVSGTQAGLKDWKAINKDLSNTKIMILETAPEAVGGPDEFKRIQKAWYNWLNQAKCENIFIEKNLRRNDVESEIQKFIESNLKSNPNEFDDVNISDSPGQVYSEPIPKPIPIDLGEKKTENCDHETTSTSYKIEVQGLLKVFSKAVFEKIRNNAIRDVIKLQKEDKEISYAEFRKKILQGSLKNRKIYHVGVNPVNCRIEYIEVE